VLKASAPADETQRLRTLTLALHVPIAFESLASRVRTRSLLPGRQPPPPEPFARTRRPLLI
jgi:hypothetical protein